ncbi:flavodoxin [Peptoniphilus indolicus ATCC 29427]|uniref:Flavodoxin n=2 Tax=Peptoniphilus indolicus TaxID=33030 RepID=G4D688_9FIRM|nr:hypothetical protein [Peptoniphilus indolicus]EGY76659.1 flavodoxin [Peptoniphilus indolicus ATCC 29427]
MNTERLIFSLDDVDIFNTTKLNNLNFSKYDYIGFASGIYYGEMSKNILDAARKIILKDSAKVFIVYTCGICLKNYSKSMEHILNSRNLDYIGEFSCRGYDNYGPFKIFGGISKKHPTQNDITNFKKFIYEIQNL